MPPLPHASYAPAKRVRLSLGPDEDNFLVYLYLLCIIKS